MARAGMTLGEFLDRMAGTQFRDGVSDCALVVADWLIEAVGCSDPAHDLRGKYTSASGRMKLLKRRGGLKKVMTDCIARVGLERTDRPVAGDVGLVAFGKRPTAAICLGEMWAAQGRGVVAKKPDRVIAAWRVT